MGLDAPSVILLCAAKSLGVDFTDTLMIGRQNFWNITAEELRTAFSALRVNRDAETFLRENKYGEPFFNLLGARTVESLDYSSYEDATHIRDMNRPVPDNLRGRYSAVHDGGTIEHVFNAPQAFKNSMEMVRVGGHLTQVNVANNFTGHGFWQFSPELIYSLFSAANGFETVTVLMHEVQPGGAWYVVADPERVGRRVELCNAAPTYILTIAKRVAAAHVLASPPQQSDYVPKWIGAETTAQPPELPNHPFPEPLYHRIAEDDLLAGNLPKMAYTDPD